MNNQDTLEQLTMNPADLYREEVFTDQRTGTIRRLTPVDGDGAPDPSRPVEYQGQAQVMTPAGALPLSFELEASNLAEAAQQFAPAAAAAIEEAVEEIKRLQREAQSSIVMPGQGGGSGTGLPGGLPGSGFKR